jgi:ribosomal protein L11 methyltransferase
MSKTYLQFDFDIANDAIKEMLIAELSDIGFDGFEENEARLTAFIESANFNADEFDEIITQHKLSFSKKIIPEQNWNALWEQNFQPVIISDAVAIRAHFHPPVTVQHEIIITPKMSFGTGHHATTHMMLEQMLAIDFKGKSVLDYGTGTGVLAIYAEKLGAAAITAIDNDEWSINNASENIYRNNCVAIKVLRADKPVEGNAYDVVLANINKNIITDNFKSIVASLGKNSTLLLSGLLAEDEADILELASAFSLQHQNTYKMDKWICMKFIIKPDRFK